MNASGLPLLTKLMFLPSSFFIAPLLIELESDISASSLICSGRKRVLVFWFFLKSFSLIRISCLFRLIFVGFVRMSVCVCGYKCNIDFNASVNLASSFFESLENPELVLVKDRFVKKDKLSKNAQKIGRSSGKT